MTDDTRYLWFRNWERFQHYRDRTPEWIKGYTEVLSSDEYLELSLARRGMLHGLWLEFAASRRRLRLNTASLSRRLNGRVTMADIVSLNDAGFLDIVASSQLAACEQTYSEALASRAPAQSREQNRVDKEKEEPKNPREGAGLNGTTTHLRVDPRTELDLARLNAWIGDDADERTAAVLRHNWTTAGPDIRTQILTNLDTTNPRHRAKWLIGTLKAAAHQGAAA